MFLHLNKRNNEHCLQPKRRQSCFQAPAKTLLFASGTCAPSELGGFYGGYAL